WPASTVSPSRTRILSIRPPILEPTRMSRASTVPEPWRPASRWNQPMEYAAAPATPTTTTRIRMSLRFIKCGSSPEQGNFHFGWRRRKIAGCQSFPKNFERRFHARLQTAVGVERPDQQSSENGLPKNLGDFERRKVIANF